jgi:hypothetical protein
VEIRPENGSIQRAADHSLGDGCRRRTSFHGADFVYRFSVTIHSALIVAVPRVLAAKLLGCCRECKL